MWGLVFHLSTMGSWSPPKQHCELMEELKGAYSQIHMFLRIKYPKGWRSLAHLLLIEIMKNICISCVQDNRWQFF